MKCPWENFRDTICVYMSLRKFQRHELRLYVLEKMSGPRIVYICPWENVRATNCVYMSLRKFQGYDSRLYVPEKISGPRIAFICPWENVRATNCVLMSLRKCQGHNLRLYAPEKISRTHHPLWMFTNERINLLKRFGKEKHFPNIKFKELFLHHAVKLLLQRLIIAVNIVKHGWFINESNAS